MTAREEAVLGRRPRWWLWVVAVVGVTIALIVWLVGFGQPFFTWNENVAADRSTRAQLLAGTLLAGAAVLTALNHWRRAAALELQVAESEKQRHSTEAQTTAALELQAVEAEKQRRSAERQAVDNLTETRRHNDAITASARRTRLGDQFARAVEHCGANATATRLGGLFSLEALLKDSPETYGETIYDFLVAYLREYSLPELKEDEPQRSEALTVLDILRRNRDPLDQHVPRLTDHAHPGSGPHLVGGNLSGCTIKASLAGATGTAAR